MEWETFVLKFNTRNMVEKLFPDPFMKNQKWAYLWIKGLKLCTVLFLLYAKLRNIKLFWNWPTNHFLLTQINTFKNSNRSPELVSLPNFHVIFYYLSKFRCLYCSTSCDRINFGIFLIKPLFLHDQTVKRKMWISW